MKKRNLLLAAVAIGLASCSNDGFFGNENNLVQSSTDAISFGSAKTAVTRADHVEGDAADLLGKNYVVEGVKGNGTFSSYAASSEVFDHYNVNYIASSANTTESNTNNWEYVNQDKHANSAATAQTIKYWDYTASQYDFVAFSYGKNNTASKPTLSDIDFTKIGSADAVYTVTGTASELANSYVADLVTLYNRNGISEYKTAVVTPKFRSLGTKVRIAFYETVPGYAVSNVKFYSEAWDGTSATTTASSDTPTLFAASAVFPSTTSKGTMSVSFPTVGWAKSANGTLSPDYNQAHVTFTESATDAEKLAKTKTFAAMNYTAGKENAEKCTSILGRTSNTATYAGTGDAYEIVLPLGKSDNDNVQVRIEYDLYPIDGGNEVIHVCDARAVVPAKYCDWKPNYAYTYIFKISDATNGWTGVDGSGNVVEGLTPITFDAVVVDSQDGVQETITGVTTPSITTYQEGVNASAISEYKPGAIYITGLADAAATPTYDNITLYEATVTAGAPENTQISENTAKLAYEQGAGATAGTYDKTNVTLVQMTSGFTNVTAVPSADGNTMAINAIKLTAAGGKVYVARFEPTAGKVTYKVIRVASEGVAGIAYNWQAAVNSYTYTATVTATGGNEVTFTYASGSVSADKHEIMNDIARYLGAVYYAGGATAIDFNSKAYSWDPTSAGNLQGSNWYSNATKHTLVKDITIWYGSNSSATQIVLKIDGTDTTLKFVQL